MSVGPAPLVRPDHVQKASAFEVQGEAEHVSFVPALLGFTCARKYSPAVSAGIGLSPSKSRRQNSMDQSLVGSVGPDGVAGDVGIALRGVRGKPRHDILLVELANFESDNVVTMARVFQIPSDIKSVRPGAVPRVVREVSGSAEFLGSAGLSS